MSELDKRKNPFSIHRQRAADLWEQILRIIGELNLEAGSPEDSAALWAAIVAIQGKLTEIQTEYTGLFTEVNNSIHSLEIRDVQLAEQINIVNTTIQVINNSLQGVSDNLTGNQEEINALLLRLAQSEGNIVAINGALENLQNQIDNLPTTGGGEGGTVDLTPVWNAVHGVEEAITYIYVDIQTLMQWFSELEMKVDELEQKVDAIETTGGGGFSISGVVDTIADYDKMILQLDATGEYALINSYDVKAYFRGGIVTPTPPEKDPNYPDGGYAPGSGWEGTFDISYTWQIPMTAPLPDGLDMLIISKGGTISSSTRYGTNLFEFYYDKDGYLVSAAPDKPLMFAFNKITGEFLGLRLDSPMLNTIDGTVPLKSITGYPASVVVSTIVGNEESDNSPYTGLRIEGTLTSECTITSIFAPLSGAEYNIRRLMMPKETIHRALGQMIAFDISGSGNFKKAEIYHKYAGNNSGTMPATARNALAEEFFFYTKENIGESINIDFLSKDPGIFDRYVNNVHMDIELEPAEEFILEIRLRRFQDLVSTASVRVTTDAVLRKNLVDLRQDVLANTIPPYVPFCKTITRTTDTNATQGSSLAGVTILTIDATTFGGADYFLLTWHDGSSTQVAATDNACTYVIPAGADSRYLRRVDALQLVEVGG